MSSIANLVNATQFDTSLTTSSRQPTTKDNITALAIVNPNVLPVWGGNYTDLSSTTLVFNAANAAAIARDAALRGSAKFFTNRMINGTRTPTLLESDTVFGDSVEAEETGEETVNCEITYKGAWYDPSGFKKLTGRTDSTILIFTNNTVEVVNGIAAQAMFKSAVLPLGGSSMNYAKGTFRVLYRHDAIHQSYPLYTGSTGDIDTPVNLTVTAGTLSNVTSSSCAGDYAGYAFTTGGSAGSIPLDVNDGVNCVTWELYVANPTTGAMDSASGNTQASINSSAPSGGTTVTIPTTHASGTTNYIAIARNQSGVIGEYKFKIVASA